MKLQKFENVDVIASLEAIMKQNTAFYQSDFDIDKQILRKAAVSLIPEDKRLLWFSRPSGTCCFRERDVFLKDTRQHNTWRFYGEQTRDTILAYAVELTGTEQEKIKGNLYELDYLQHFREVIEKSIPADNYTLIYEHGELTKPAGQYFDGDTDPQLGKFIRFEAQPNDPEALKSLLREQQKKRTPHTQRDFQLHIAALHDRQIETEARRIVENVKGLGEPDSPEKTHCAVELSPYFVPLATDKDMERLLSMLPYKSLSLSTLEGRHGVYALIDKSERNKEISLKDMVIDKLNRTVTVKDIPVLLTGKEFDLLLFLASNKGRVFTKKQIYSQVWEEEYAFDDSNIMSFISKLRKKIEPDPDHPFYILTVRGVGYRFNKEV